MARIRTIKPEIWKDDRFIDLSSDIARLLFVGLLNFVDDEGRIAYSPREIRREIFPDRVELDVTPMLEELDSIGLAIRYSVDGKGYFAIRNFAKHQKIDRKTPSKYPAPPTNDTTGAPLDESSTSEQRQLDEPSTSPRRVLDENERVIAESSTTARESSPLEWKGKDQEGKGGEGEKEVEEEPEKLAPEVLDSDQVPEGLNPYQYARALLEQLSLPASRSLLEIVGSSITALVKSSRGSPASAYRVIRDRARAAEKRGEAVNRFWFEDGSYNHDGERRSDGHRTKFANESDQLAAYLHGSDAGNLAH